LLVNFPIINQTQNVMKKSLFFVQSLVWIDHKQKGSKSISIMSNISFQQFYNSHAWKLKRQSSLHLKPTSCSCARRLQISTCPATWTPFSEWKFLIGWENRNFLWKLFWRLFENAMTRKPLTPRSNLQNLTFLKNFGRRSQKHLN